MKEDGASADGAGAAGPVLVPRPEPGASETAARLRAMGLTPLVVPLLASEPTGAPSPPDAIDAVVLTSASAARELARRGWRAPDLTIHAVGEATARVAREAGLGRAVVGLDGVPAADGAALGAMLAGRYAGATLLYPCAEDRRPGLEAALKERGVRVAAWPLYRTVALADAPGRLRAALGDVAPAAVLLHSPSAARALAGAALGDAPLICLSAAIARAVPPGTEGGRVVAGRPDEAALLDALLGALADERLAMGARLRR